MGKTTKTNSCRLDNVEYAVLRLIRKNRFRLFHLLQSMVIMNQEYMDHTSHADARKAWQHEIDMIRKVQDLLIMTERKELS